MDTKHTSWLAPCPFCGGESWLNDYEAKYSDLPPMSRAPQCRSCGASLGYLKTPAKATEAWNRRAFVEAERVEQLQADYNDCNAQRVRAEMRIVELDRDRTELARVADEWATEAHERGNKLIAAEGRMTVAVDALEEAIWSLGSFGQLVADEEGGNTEGLEDEVVVRMTFPDPEYGGEKTLLGELFVRAFRKAKFATESCREARAAIAKATQP